MKVHDDDVERLELREICVGFWMKYLTGKKMYGLLDLILASSIMYMTEFHKLEI